MGAKKGYKPWNHPDNIGKYPKKKRQPPWSEERRAKFAATVKAKQQRLASVTTEEVGTNARMEDAEAYLRQAIRTQERLLAQGKIKRRDAAHLLAELALKTLEGEL